MLKKESTGGSKSAPYGLFNPSAGLSPLKSSAVPKSTKTVSPPPPRPVSHAAVQRRVQATPKPAPVVVANNQGRVTKPKPPPPSNPGRINPKGGSGAVKLGAPAATPIPPPATIPGAIATDPAAVPEVAPPEPPDINTWLGTDAEFIKANADYDLAKTAFNTSVDTNKTNSDTSFASRLRDMQSAQTTDQGTLQEQMAGRGLLKSGVYSDALSNLNQDYTKQQTGLTNEQVAANAGFVTDKSNYADVTDPNLRQKARTDAVARRAAGYGL